MRIATVTTFILLFILTVVMVCAKV